MARALRLEVREGWHHVTARGNERKAIFRDDADRRRFLELLGEVSQRHGLVVAAYVLMDNHYHLVVRTPRANLSRAMQWLNVSYSSAFNRRHRRSGHLFQGRFKSVLVDPGEWLCELVRYVHLNPVRLRRLGLGKTQRAQVERGGEAPDPELVRRRLDELRRYPWSSHRVYAGLSAAPEWLEAERVLEYVGSGDAKGRRKWFRDYMEDALRRGLPRSPWEQVRDGVLGAAEFVQKVKREALQAVRGERRHVQQVLHGRCGLEEVRKAVEQVKGERWAQFAERHGDTGRDLFLWLGHRYCGASLGELGAAAGGMSVSAVNEALRRIRQRMLKDRALARQVARARQKCKM
jgi:putative transposase